MCQTKCGNRPKILVGPVGVTFNDMPIGSAGPVSKFHAIFGNPTRIEPIGPPAPYGHRDPFSHYYDNLGITLGENHYTYQITSIDIVLNISLAMFPTSEPFLGTLDIGGIIVNSGDAESALKDSSLQFTGTLPGTWFASVQSKEHDGDRISIAVQTLGHKLRSGRRSKRREIVSVQLGLNHDPWDTTYRPL